MQGCRVPAGGRRHPGARTRRVDRGSLWRRDTSVSSLDKGISVSSPRDQDLVARLDTVVPLPAQRPPPGTASPRITVPPPSPSHQSRARSVDIAPILAAPFPSDALLHSNPRRAALRPDPDWGTRRHRTRCNQPPACTAQPPRSILSGCFARWWWPYWRRVGSSGLCHR